VSEEANPSKEIRRGYQHHFVGAGRGRLEINSEPKMMRSTVVKRDTGSRDIVHGTSSSLNNKETNMLRSTVVKSDNSEPKMMRSTVVKRDTGSRDIVHGTSSSLNNKETNMLRSTVVSEKANPSKEIRRGYQHVYVGKKTKTCMNVHKSHKLSMKEGDPKHKLAVKRDRKKRDKIQTLMSVTASADHALPNSFFASGRPIFYSGRCYKDSKFPEGIENAHNFSAIEDLKVVNTKSGVILKSRSGDTVFTLIPRLYAIDKLRQVKKTVMSLRALEDLQYKAEIRGKKRIAVAEDNGKYITVGLKPNRSHKGITESWPKKITDDVRKEITKLMTRCGEVGKGYIESNEIRGLRIAQVLQQWKEIKGVASQPIWGSLACGKNYYLNSHTDEDFFYSLTTIASEYGVQDGKDIYNVDAEVCNYFNFAEQGIAVALRPGDVLLFNPMYHHCLSSRTSFYQNSDVFCLSLYLKTAVVGGNDNTAQSGDVK
jgi:hypothetical protein